MTKEISSKILSTKKTPPPSFVKLAMRNMVKKGNQSLIHFALTALGLIGFLLLLAVFFKPVIPQ